MDEADLLGDRVAIIAHGNDPLLPNAPQIAVVFFPQMNPQTHTYCKLHYQVSCCVVALPSTLKQGTSFTFGTQCTKHIVRFIYCCFYHDHLSTGMVQAIT